MKVLNVELPYRFPGLPRSEYDIALNNVAAWKKVHTYVENLYFKFLTFDHQVIRCEEVINQGNDKLQQYKQNICIKETEKYIIELRIHINIFVNDLEELPEGVLNTDIIKLLRNLFTFYTGVKRCLGSMPEQSSFEILKEVTRRIRELLLHALHIADQVLEEHFRNRDK